MSRFVREFTLTSTAGLSLLVTAFRGKDGGQQTIGELPEKPHWSCLEITHYCHNFFDISIHSKTWRQLQYLMACSVSCLFLPCNIVQDENGRHWFDPGHTLSTLVITTDAEVAMIIKLITTRWLNMVCITCLLVFECP